MNTYTLTTTQRSLALSLATDRQRMVDEANHRLAEINAAERELVELLRQVAGLPEGAYRLVGDASEIRLEEYNEEAPE